MPYIDRKLRRSLWPEFDSPETPGELNYVLSSVCSDYLTYRGLGYSAINEVIGVLECAKLELYRRIAGPYEEKKRIEHGDVYAEELL